MTVVLVNQTFVASQLASLNEQLKDLGIRVTINGKKGIETLGYVDTIASTKKPLKVKIRYDEGVNPIRASQEIGFLFIVRKGRFVLHKGKDK